MYGKILTSAILVHTCTATSLNSRMLPFPPRYILITYLLSSPVMQESEKFLGDSST